MPIKDSQTHALLTTTPSLQNTELKGPKKYSMIASKWAQQRATTCVQ